MRSRVFTFLAGFISGIVALYVVLWFGGVLSPYLNRVKAQAIVRAAPISAGTADRVRMPARAAAFASPIAGLTAANLQDTFAQERDGRRHEAIDIMEPRGTPVHAVVDGVIRKLFLSKAGGNTIYEFDIAREYCYYYAHLDRYAGDLREGMQVQPGDVIGYVGSTGNASPGAPHLHFEIHVLGPEKQWWEGTPVNPYPMLLAVAGR